MVLSNINIVVVLSAWKNIFHHLLHSHLSYALASNVEPYATVITDQYNKSSIQDNAILTLFLFFNLQIPGDFWVCKEGTYANMCNGCIPANATSAEFYHWMMEGKNSNFVRLRQIVVLIRKGNQQWEKGINMYNRGTNNKNQKQWVN